MTDQPTIPNSDRAVEYSPVSSAGPFPVPFAVFDGAGADLAVDLDGESQSGWTFSGTLVPGFYGAPNTWVNGSVMLAGQATGSLVITGDRAPRRQSQFKEGRGVPARDLNAELNTLTAVDRELYLRGKQSVTVPYGEDGFRLPPAMERAEKYIAFNAIGQPIYPAAAPSPGIPTDGAVTDSKVAEPTDAEDAISSTKLRFQQLGANARIRILQNKMRETISTGDWGDPEDGGELLQYAIDRSIARERILNVDPGNWLLTEKLVIASSGVRLLGQGTENTTFRAASAFGELLELPTGSTDVVIEGINFDTTGFNTRCVSIPRGQTPTFRDCGFKGDMGGSGGDLVWSQGDIFTFDNCKFETLHANAWGLALDSHNQNCAVQGNTRFGGIGNGLRVEHVDGAKPRVEGLKLLGCFFINTGGINLDLGDSFLTTAVGNVFDQASGYAVLIRDGASKTEFIGNWIGMRQSGVGICLRFEPSAGPGHKIIGNDFYFGSHGIVAAANSGQRVSGLKILGNDFDQHATAAIQLDSVSRCIVEGNIDFSPAPSSGSWVTLGSFGGGGDYSFDGNIWNPATQAALHTGSSYKIGNDRGLVYRNKGANSPGGSVNTMTLPHGMSVAPRHVLVTPHGNAGNFFVSNITSTTFNINWGLAGDHTFHWEASF
ncbi:right-handed parallel beta-helix repeat-containing protein [Bosea sp. (in: a-proteobacteria)]|uniref:right-handed parallel beta-helix repeat-containing protein n=1 Tax=Bosea sp. (in: a-proteobacteria) TaxID=1871050 RepID=UPI003B3B6B60